MTSKRLKMCKKALVLFFAFLFSIECMAAVVSDNDGAAFVTKAEFEALKMNFSEQIDNYNESIGKKIDGAIASYLDGLKLNKEVLLDSEIELARKDNVNNAIFAQFQTPQETKHTADVDAAFFLSRDHGCGPRWANRAHGYHIISNCHAGGRIDWKKYNGDDNAGTAADYISAYYFAGFPFAKLDHTNYRSTGNVEDWYLVDITRKRLYFMLRTTYNAFGNAYETVNTTAWKNTFGHVLKTFNTNFTAYAETKNGPGSYTWAGDDSTMPYLWKWRVQPTSQIEHRWSERDASDRNKNSFLYYNLSGTIPDDNTKCVDYNFRDKYYVGNSFTARIQKNLPSTSTHAGGNSCSAIVIWYWNGSTDEYWEDTSSNVYSVANDVNFWWSWNIPLTYDLKWSKLTNRYYTGRIGIAYYKYYGIPICKTTANVGKLKFKLKFTNTRTDTGSPLAYTYQIMDKQFPNGAMPSDLVENGIDHVLKRGTVSAGQASSEIEFELEKSKIWDTNNGDYIYLKVEPSGSTQKIEVETIGDIKYEEEG